MSRERLTDQELVERAAELAGRRRSISPNSVPTMQGSG